MQKLDINLIRIDGGTQLRARNDEEAIAEYSQRLRAGEEAPPVDVFHDGVEYWLANGFHRFHAARACERTEIDANIHTGTQTDAILFACGANAEHGVRRTAQDKRNAVTAALKVYEGRDIRRSDEYVAKLCCVSREFVTRHRPGVIDHTSNPMPTKVQGKDGRVTEARGKPKAKSKPLRVIAEPERRVAYSSIAIGELRLVWDLAAKHEGARDALVRVMESLILEHKKEVTS